MAARSLGKTLQPQNGFREDLLGEDVWLMQKLINELVLNLIANCNGYYFFIHTAKYGSF